MTLWLRLGICGVHKLDMSTAYQQAPLAYSWTYGEETSEEPALRGHQTQTQPSKPSLVLTQKTNRKKLTSEPSLSQGVH